ncbi:MAG: biotin synthase BioB [Deltaproteobacteria bacterium]|nr:biotin synthase BioB [Deltaproteobacteria bacterium]
MSTISITERIIKDAGEFLSYEDACKLADITENNIDLIVYANKLRNNCKDKSVFTCSIINAKSGLCSQDCAFCAQSGRHKTGVKVYPLLSEEKLVENALRMEEAGATTYSMVTSGFSPTDKELDTLTGAVLAIKKKTSLSVCTSIGVLTESTVKRLKACGVSTCHHNLETARSYFDRICTTHDYDDDLQTVKIAKSAGLKVCSGGIFGLGETWSQRVELAFTLKELDVDSIPINFLNPIAGTRMENMPLLPPMEALKIIALMRIINPKKEITICGGREKTLKDFQSWIFLAGANGLMIGNYLTTKGRSIDMDIDIIEAMGLEIIKGDKKWT